MILALDIGNTQIHGGVFDADRLVHQFRKTTRGGGTSDETGVFLRAVLRENGVDPTCIRQVSLCSVVPDAVHSVASACIKYFGVAPFVLQSGVKTGLNIKYRNPAEVGTDRIANAVAAVHLYPGRHLIVTDYGTATTFCAISKDREYLGGLILPGFRISMEALESRTARLPAVEILVPREAVARSTVESIQSGLYFGNLYALKGLVARIRDESFHGEPVTVVGTGGFSRMLQAEKVFDAVIPELVLIGLHRVLAMNS